MSPYDDMSNKFRGIRTHLDNLGLRATLDIDPFESAQDIYGLCKPSVPLKVEEASLKGVKRRRT